MISITGLSANLGQYGTLHFMKNIFLLVFMLLVVCAGCCTKRDCDPGLYGNSFTTKLFDVSTLKQARIEIVTKASNAPIDTAEILSVYEGLYTPDVTVIYTSAFLKKLGSNQYKIRISISPSSVYTVTEILGITQECNSCYFPLPDRDAYFTMTGYLINGQRKTGTSFVLD